MSTNRWVVPNLSSELKQFGFLTSEEQSESVQKVFESARAEGYQKGLSEGARDARIDVDTVLTSLQSYKSQLQNPLEQVDQTVMKAMIKLSLNLAEKIVRTEIQAEPLLMTAQLDGLLSTLTATTADISVSMHPDDAKAISGLIDQDERFRQLNILEDSSFGRGDCLLSTPVSLIETKIKDQIAHLAVQLEDLISEEELSD